MNTHVESNECFAVFLKSEATTKIVECNTGKPLRYFCRACGASVNFLFYCDNPLGDTLILCDVF